MTTECPVQGGCPENALSKMDQQKPGKKGVPLRETMYLVSGWLFSTGAADQPTVITTYDLAKQRI